MTKGTAKLPWNIQKHSFLREEKELVTIGKAYSGITDSEIQSLTSRFKELTIQRYGPVHVVRPEVVLEVAFDTINKSQRHKSGFALRFPRIKRIRDDKPVEDIDDIEKVKAIFEKSQPRQNKAMG